MPQPPETKDIDFEYEDWMDFVGFPDNFFGTPMTEEEYKAQKAKDRKSDATHSDKR